MNLEKIEILRRPSIRSLVHRNEWLQFDKMFVKSVEYNKVLFYAIHDYYDDVGWLYLIKYYISYSYTLEKQLGLYGLDELKLTKMLMYASDTIYPWEQYTLTDEDRKLFELGVDVLLFYFKIGRDLRSSHRKPIEELISRGRLGDL